VQRSERQKKSHISFWDGDRDRNDARFVIGNTCSVEEEQAPEVMLVCDVER